MHALAPGSASSSSMCLVSIFTAIILLVRGDENLYLGGLLMVELPDVAVTSLDATHYGD